MPPGLIHEHQSPNVEARNQPPPQSPRSLIAFRGYLRLFLSGHPPGSRAMLRLIVASETSMPVSSKKGSQCSLRVRWGFVFSCFGSHSLKASPFTDGLPGIFIVWTSPVWRLLLSQRLMVERETPKRSWTSFSGYAALYCSERLQSEVPRISAHGGHSRAGSLLMQTAVGAYLSWPEPRVGSGLFSIKEWPCHFSIKGADFKESPLRRRPDPRT